MEKRTIGAFLAVLRKASGMTQRQLAEKLNVSDKAISRWERDEALPDLTMIPVLAEIFGVTADELLRGQRSTGEGPGPQREEKTQKQLQYLLDKTRTDYKIRILICGMIACVGVLAAAILNLAFLRGIAGFWVGCIFFLGAAVLQTIFGIQFDSRLHSQAFAGEALEACKAAMGKYTYWGYTLIVALFTFTLPLAGIEDAYMGLTFRSWLQGAVPVLLIPAAAGAIWFVIGVRSGRISMSAERKLLLGTVAFLMVGMLVTAALQTELAFNLNTDLRWTGEGTLYTNAEEFKARMELSLDEQGNYRKTKVIEWSADQPRVIACLDESGSYNHAHGTRTAHLGQTVEYFPLNHTIDYHYLWQPEGSTSITLYTWEESAAAETKAAWVLAATCLIYPVEIAAAVFIYKKKAGSLC